MSEAIWLLSTKGRPKMCQRVLDACEQTGMTSKGIVYVDETVDDYQDLRLPWNWIKVGNREWGGLQASMQYVYEKFPEAKCYGWLADDTIPRTEGWDRKVEDAAGDWALAYCNDLWLGPSQHDNGVDLTAGLCWGGELVRTVGWWALPNVKQAGIDTAWISLLRPLLLLRYLPEVIVEHENYRTGKREKDPTDNWDRNGYDYINADIATRDNWSVSPEMRLAARRIVEVNPGMGVGIRWDRDYPIQRSAADVAEPTYLRPGRGQGRFEPDPPEVQPPAARLARMGF